MLEAGLDWSPNKRRRTGSRSGLFAQEEEAARQISDAPNRLFYGERFGLHHQLHQQHRRDQQAGARAKQSSRSKLPSQAAEADVPAQQCSAGEEQQLEPPAPSEEGERSSPRPQALLQEDAETDLATDFGSEILADDAHCREHLKRVEHATQLQQGELRRGGQY